ncbi:MAG TPA: HDOD domain-containing protein [Ideonella sp.]|uniref:HDOD domain-containing protein n=1 Tax=Ideonella sp. TaxID=1929293 RepID=UPI002C8DFFB1|nr:HDOD domain-containing protein [Ideonella sp.]HSI51806.1 HDOD domain-containing protein [Ideonella sp.]
MTPDPQSFAARLDGRIAKLPPLPEALRAVWQALDKENLSTAHCVHLIEQDSVLAGRTLRMANSAFYGLAGRVARIGDAVNLLGLRAMGSMLAAVSIGDALQPAAAPAGWSLRGYTRHAVAAAVAARALAPRLGMDAEQAFLAGLMHDIGQLVLVSQFAPEAAAVRAHAQAGDLPSHLAEQAVLGMDHAEIGARLARHWHFPALISEAMANHHQPGDALAAGVAELTVLIHVGDALAHALDLADEPDEAVPPLDAAAWLQLRLDEPAALALLSRIEAEARAMSEALGG